MKYTRHGNTMRLYTVFRSHDFKVMAKVRGYEFGLALKELYEKRFKENSFILTDKNQDEKGQKRAGKKGRIDRGVSKKDKANASV